jgi:hypothetical protein
MTTAAKISIQIDAQTATLQKGFGEATAAIKKLDAGMSGSVAAGMAKFAAGWIAIQGAIGAARGVMSTFLQTVDSMSAEQDWADRLGIAADELAALGYAAEQTGASQEILNASLQKMQNNLSDAGQEGGTAVKALQELNLSAQQLRELTPDRQFVAIAEAMSQVSNQGDRTRLTLDVFGKSGGELNNLLREGSKGLNSYAMEAEQLGLKMGDARKYVEAFGDELHKLEVAWRSTKGNIAAGWALVLEDQTSIASRILGTVHSWFTTDFGTAVGSANALAKKEARELEQQLKQTKAAADVEAALKKMTVRGNSLTESMRTPGEVYRDSLTELNALVQKGVITWSTYARASKGALQNLRDFWRDTLKPQDWTTPGIGAATRGSAAGFSAVQEAGRAKQDNDRRHRELISWQARIEAAILKDTITIAPVSL